MSIDDEIRMAHQMRTFTVDRRADRREQMADPVIGEARYSNHADSDAELCRQNGWRVGTRLAGDEGYGPTVIEITAIGEELILAKPITHRGEPLDLDEDVWTLCCRPWRAVVEPNPSPTCALCGHNPACGWALVTSDGVRLCHADTRASCSTDRRSCYVRWTVYGERPA